MSDITIAFLLGLLEGLTEFIPVSSTGHLIIVGEYLTFSTAINDTFSIAIQLGAIASVVLIEWAVFKPFIGFSHWTSHTSKIIITAILPALVMGFLFYDSIRYYLFNSTTVSVGLLVGALLMIYAERAIKPKAELTTQIEHISHRQALKIGLFQCAALWPGMSRSGSTIIGGLFSQLSHECAARFSFIIAVPVMCIAVTYELLQMAETLSRYDLQLIGIGFITAFCVSSLSVLSFLKLLRRWQLLPFALYRIGLAVMVILL